MNTQKAIYYPACSVGTYLGAIRTNEQYSGHSFRFYNKDENPFFYHPYLLISAAHNYKKNNLREELNFPTSPEHLLMVDSGGFQLATGAISEDKWNNEKALNWSEQNGDIFPILDVPPYITGMTGTDDFSRFKECLKKSVLSAKYYSEHRSKSNCKILNVLHGRNLKEFEYWYSFIHKFEFDGWAKGGIKSLADLLRSVLFFKNKGEFDKNKKVYFHIFGISRASFMPYIEYVQHLLNKENYNVVITFDSSYPLKTAAFGNYFLFTSNNGVSQMGWSNKYKDKYEKSLNESHKLPCSCPICISVPNVKNFLLNPKEFYNVTTSHNLYRFFEYKTIIENLIFLDIEELWETSFNSNTRRNFKIIEKAFKMKEGWHDYIVKEIKEDDNIDINSSMEELF